MRCSVLSQNIREINVIFLSKYSHLVPICSPFITGWESLVKTIEMNVLKYQKCAYVQLWDEKNYKKHINSSWYKSRALTSVHC